MAFDGIRFFNGFVRHPRQVGSIIPSSSWLKQDIINIADIASAKLVVELGPGTGGTTRSFLRTLSGDAKLLAIEISPHFVSHLQQIDDPRLIVHNGNAEDLLNILEQYKMHKPEVIVSGIPFSTMSDAMSQRVIASIAQALSINGRFLAYQFRDHVARAANPVFGPANEKLELRNIPPLHIYCWQKH